MEALIIQPGLYKKAAEQGEGPSFQQQFGILSNALISDKFPQMANYKLAFQLIDKDDDNTKAVGVAVYLMGQAVIFIPSFFRNGKIRTGDMFFSPELQTMLPISDAWLAWIKNRSVGDGGDVVPASMVMGMSNLTPGSVRTRETNDPIMKSASESLKAMIAPGTGDIDIFAITLNMGKQASQQLVSMLSGNTDLLNDTLRFYPPQRIADFVKEASALFESVDAVPAYSLVTPLDKQAALLTADERDILNRDGFFICKTAAEAPQAATEVIKAVRPENVSREFKAVSKDCKCRLIAGDGSLIERTVLHPTPISIGDELNCCQYHGCRKEVPAAEAMRTNQNKLYATTNVSHQYTTLRPGTAAQSSSIQDLKSNAGIGEPLSGSVIRIPYGAVIICPDGRSYSISNSLQKVTGSQKPSWVTYNAVIEISDDADLVRPLITANRVQLPKETRILFPSDSGKNGDYNREDQTTADQHQSSYCTVMEAARSVEAYIRKNYDRLKVYSDGSEFVINGPKEGPAPKPMQVKEAAMHLVTAYSIGPADAKAILRDSSNGASFAQAKSASFLLAKKAEMDDRAWDPSNISSTHLLNRQPQVIQTELSGYTENPDALKSAITTAAQQGIKEVFDVTTLKLLAQSSDVLEMVGDYPSDFMATLDKLCRLLFQFYWQIDQMEQQYGMVKIKALEQSIRNSLKSLSELTIFLKLRSSGAGATVRPATASQGLQTDSML